MHVPVGNEWYLCDRSDQPDHEYIEFQGSGTLALQWAHQFDHDLFAKRTLRDLLGASYASRSDEHIAREVAWRLTSGVWFARRRVVERPVIDSAVPVEAPPFPKERRRPSPQQRRGPEPDAPLFPSDIDPMAIAAAQKQAAALGIPFCEECLRAASGNLVVRGGNLEVTVLDSKTGKPISGATADVTGPAASSGATDGSGKVNKNDVPAGSYTVTAKNSGYTTENGTATVPASGTGKIEIKLTPITVAITLAQPVACPGHPLEITATGSPAGGTYAWTIAAPAADLVDAAGAAARSGNKVNLRGFQSDTNTGDIPAQTAKIAVTYTYTNGQTAAANQDVVIHEIKFKLTDDSISKSPTAANESATVLDITFGASATMSTNPKVEIDLDASCPRKTDCAKNHQTGWLQTVLTSVVDLRYTHTQIKVTPPMPVRDAIAGVPAPFYLAPIQFTGDKDKQTVHHEDSPGVQAPWTDPRPASPAAPPPKNKQLRTVTRSMSFTAWLVVQNIEWAAHHPSDSHAFIGHFDWSMSITVAVDFTKAIGSRGSPHSSPPVVPAKITKGKGGSSPDLGAVVYNTTANDPANQHITAAPGI
jgi:hypothetical protein